MHAQLNVEYLMMNSIGLSHSFSYERKKEYTSNPWRKVVWVQGYCNLTIEHGEQQLVAVGIKTIEEISICDFIYFFGEILDDDVIGIYLNGIINYFGQKCELENGNFKQYSGVVIVKKEKFEKLIIR